MYFVTRGAWVYGRVPMRQLLYGVRSEWGVKHKRMNDPRIIIGCLFSCSIETNAHASMFEMVDGEITKLLS